MPDRLIDGTPKRRYVARVRDNAAIIAAEVIQHGRSRGWCGDADAFDGTREILARYGIAYTDDMWGEWTAQEDPR